MLSDGTLVTLHYHGTLDDGSVFDSSRGKRPRAFVLGRGQLIPAFEAAVREMTPGQKRTVRLSPDEAYGPHRTDRVYETPIDDAPPGLQPGDEVQLVGGAPARVVAVSERSVRLDANHPLAGKALTFEIELLTARP